MNNTLKKIIELCLQEKQDEDILNQVGHNSKNVIWIQHIKDIMIGLGDIDFTNAPEKHVVNGEEVWVGGSFDAARERVFVKTTIKDFTDFKGVLADEISEIIINSAWSSKHSFMRWKKDPASVALETREMFENV